MADAAPTDSASTPTLARHHLRLGWWGLGVFVTAGLALEALHAFKVGLYLDVGQETRRLMWRLAHAHGTLLSLVQIAFALSVGRLDGFAAAPRRLASRCLAGALVLMPAGFALGGLEVHGGDPGLGILLVPPGGILLLVGVLVTARATSR